MLKATNFSNNDTYTPPTILMIDLRQQSVRDKLPKIISDHFKTSAMSNHKVKRPLILITQRNGWMFKAVHGLGTTIQWYQLSISSNVFDLSVESFLKKKAYSIDEMDRLGIAEFMKLYE